MHWWPLPRPPGVITKAQGNKCLESEALSWETRIVEPCHRGTAQTEKSELGIVPNPCHGQDTLQEGGYC